MEALLESISQPYYALVRGVGRRVEWVGDIQWVGLRGFGGVDDGVSSREERRRRRCR